MFKTTSGRLLWLILGAILVLSLPLGAQDRGGRGGRGSQGINGGDQSRIDFTDGSLATGAKPTGTQSLCLTGGVLTGCDVVASDAGLTSLASADSAAGLPYTTGANTWSRVAAGTDLCPYFSSSSAMTTASCVSYGRGLLGYASEALFKAGVNLEADVDFNAYSATLAAVAGSTYTGDDAITTTGTVTSGTWSASFGDGEISSLAGLTSAADRLPYYTGSGTAALATYTATARSIDDDASIAAVRDTLNAGIGSIACASPCTPAAGVTVATVSGTATINLPALSTYVDGQALQVHCDSASSCPVTGDPSDSGTCDGGSAGAACSAITVPAHGVIGFRRTSSSSWGSVQPGSVSTVSALEIRLVAGVWTAYEQTWSGSAWVDADSGEALTVEAAGTCGLSGTTLTIPSGMTSAAAPHNAPCKWYVDLSGVSFWSTSIYGVYAIDATETSAGIDDKYARWGWSLAAPSGSFDSNTENRYSIRRGWDTSFTPDNFVIRTATTTGSYPTLLYAGNDRDVLTRYTWAQAASLAWIAVDASSDVTGTVTPGTTLATRLYVLGLASGTMTADTAFGDPRIRLIRLTGTP